MPSLERNDAKGAYTTFEREDRGLMVEASIQGLLIKETNTTPPWIALLTIYGSSVADLEPPITKYPRELVL